MTSNHKGVLVFHTINGVVYIRPRRMTEYENLTNPISPSRSTLETFCLAEVALQRLLSFRIFLEEGLGNLTLTVRPE